MVPDISIVTPCLNMGDYLSRCLASVADQVGVSIEHIVVDGGSTDATLDGLRLATGAGPDALEGALDRAMPGGHRFRLTWRSARDSGMYDAINRGLRRARAPLVAYLNADEQYLPGALETVVTTLSRQPRVDILFGDVVVMASDGGYICSRQVLRPLAWHTRHCQLNTFTAAMFVRRRVVAEDGFEFDPTWRNLGDVEWMLRVMREKKVRMHVIRRYLAAFTDRGDNLNLQASADVERVRLGSGIGLIGRCAPLWCFHHRVRRLLHGLYRPAAFTYAVFPPGDNVRRMRVTVTRPRFLWASRLEPQRCP